MTKSDRRAPLRLDLAAFLTEGLVCVELFPKPGGRGGISCRPLGRGQWFDALHRVVDETLLELRRREEPSWSALERIVKTAPPIRLWYWVDPEGSHEELVWSMLKTATGKAVVVIDGSCAVVVGDGAYSQDYVREFLSVGPGPAREGEPSEERRSGDTDVPPSGDDFLALQKLVEDKDAEIAQLREQGIEQALELERLRHRIEERVEPEVAEVGSCVTELNLDGLIGEVSEHLEGVKNPKPTGLTPIQKRARVLLDALLDKIEGVELSKEETLAVGPLVGPLIREAGFKVQCTQEGCPDPRPGALRFIANKAASLGGQYSLRHYTKAGRQATHALGVLLPGDFRALLVGG